MEYLHYIDHHWPLLSQYASPGHRSASPVITHPLATSRIAQSVQPDQVPIDGSAATPHAASLACGRMPGPRFHVSGRPEGFKGG